MIHTTQWQPRVYPFNGDVVPVQIDRLQAFDAGSTLNREKIREIGRTGIVDWRKRIPSTRVSLRQFEYGDLEFYRKLGNIADGDNDVTLDDFKTSMVDITGYMTDDAGAFTGTVWYPKLRLAGFGINIGDPQAYIERTFDLIGEDEIILENNNKYFIYQKFTATGGSPETFTVQNPIPSADPDESSKYVFRVVRVRGATTTELTYTSGIASGNQYAFTPSNSLKATTNANDVIKVYYSASAYLTGSSVFVNNNSDASALPAENTSIYLYDTANNYVYKLQSLGIDVTFDRTDYYEIGDDEVIQRGIRDKTVRVTMGRILEAHTIEEVLRGVPSTYGKLSTRNYLDSAILRVKIYSTAAKSVFSLGLKITDLSPTDLTHGVPLNDYSTRDATLESDNLLITSTESQIDS